MHLSDRPLVGTTIKITRDLDLRQVGVDDVWRLPPGTRAIVEGYSNYEGDPSLGSAFEVAIEILPSQSVFSVDPYSLEVAEMPEMTSDDMIHRDDGGEPEPLCVWLFLDDEVGSYLLHPDMPAMDDREAVEAWLAT